jgi:hypothetical protein
MIGVTDPLVSISPTNRNMIIAKGASQYLLLVRMKAKSSEKNDMA